MASNNILFITANDVTKVTPISANIDTKWFVNFIKFSQETKIKNILGQLLYDDLILKLSTNTMTPDYINLKSYITEPLAYYVLYESLPFLTFRIVNKGVMSNTDSNATAVDNKGVAYLRAEISNKAEYFANVLLKFLEDNSSLFPLYVPTSVNCTANSNSPYFSNIYFY